LPIGFQSLLLTPGATLLENETPPRVCWDSSGVYHGCGQMDHGSETLIGVVGAHGDAFELLEPSSTGCIANRRLQRLVLCAEFRFRNMHLSDYYLEAFGEVE
jgi:hypothetical protein